MVKNKLLALAALVFILAAIPITVFIVSAQRDQRSSAAENNTSAVSENIKTMASEIYDLNNDDRVNTADMAEVSSKFGDHTKPIEDINQDGTVDTLDISLVVEHWR